MQKSETQNGRKEKEFLVNQQSELRKAKLMSRISEAAVLTETAKGTECVNLRTQMLNKHRTVIINEEINAETANEAMMQLLYLESVDPKKEITIIINSPGGAVSSGLTKKGEDSCAWRKLYALQQPVADASHFCNRCYLYEMDKKLDFKDLGKKKMAVFLTISDTDRSADKLVNMFYTQAFNILCESADRDYETHYLDVPVRLYLDDFATNVVIQDFDKLISVIRSREIYTSIVLQSLSQLEDLYGSAKAATILNNCDHCLYLGGRDLSTVQYIAQMTNKSEHSVMMLPRKHYYLITTGEEPRLLELTANNMDDFSEHEVAFETGHEADFESIAQNVF